MSITAVGIVIGKRFPPNLSTSITDTVRTVADSTTRALTGGPGIFPLSMQGGTRYLVTADGQPYFLMADWGWSLLTMCTLTESAQYLDNRVAKGYNAVIVNLIEHQFCTNPPNNRNGDGPFTTPGDFTTPKAAYFDFVASIFSQALARNLTLLVPVCYMGIGGAPTPEGWYDEMVTAGTTKLATYGAWVANRFLAFPNIIWVHVGDRPATGSDMALVNAVANAIVGVSGQWLHTTHGPHGTSARIQHGTEPWFKVNNIYGYESDQANFVRTFAASEYAASTLPDFLIETTFEGEGATAQQSRLWGWQTVLNGGMGYAFGNNPVWAFTSGWPAAMESGGSVSAPYIKTLLTSFDWQNLVPDVARTFCTTPAIPAAKTASGSRGVVYHNSGITIALSQMAGPFVLARWYDPTNGTYLIDSTLAATGTRTYTHSFLNAGGGNDWVLVLDSVNATWPNEPAGWTVLTDQDCTSVADNGLWHAYSAATSVNDPTAPLSPPKVWSAPYPIGFGGGIGPINMAYETLSPKVPSIYVGFWWKVSNPWQGHLSGTNKVLYIYFTMPSDNVFIKLRGDPNALGPFNTGMISEAGHPVPGWTNQAYDENVGSTHPFVLGTWHQVEILVLASGTLKWWVDNVLIGQYTGQTWPSGIESIRLNPTWGGLGDSKSENDYFYYDHVRISKP